MDITTQDSSCAAATVGRRREPRLAYSVAEAAQATGLGRTTLYGLITRGVLPSRKIGKRRIIRGADLEALITGHADEDA